MLGGTRLELCGAIYTYQHSPIPSVGVNAFQHLSVLVRCTCMRLVVNHYYYTYARRSSFLPHPPSLFPSPYHFAFLPIPIYLSPYPYLPLPLSLSASPLIPICLSLYPYLPLPYPYLPLPYPSPFIPSLSLSSSLRPSHFLLEHLQHTNGLLQFSFSLKSSVTQLTHCIFLATLDGASAKAGVRTGDKIYKVNFLCGVRI